MNRVDVVLCRGCCCGTDKHPDTDHEAQLSAIRAAAQALPGTRLLVANCLSRCDYSNVVVVRHRPTDGKRRTVWLGGILAEPDTTALCSFLIQLAADRGGQEHPVPLPRVLERLRIASPREATEALRNLVSEAGPAPSREP
jgi:predicted metal-binding protein